MKRVLFRTMKLIGLIVIGLFSLASGAWSVIALMFSGPGSETMHYALAAGFALALLLVLAALFCRRWRWRALAAYLVLFALLMLWWSNVKPSNDRDWQTDVEVLPYATVEGDMVTVHNIRNFEYRSETDYTPHYYDKRFDVRKLNGVDLVASYWMGPSIAHVFLSFSFEGGDHLAVSIETRKEKGEDYSTLKGFFRQYELYYVVADERDVIRLRTNYRRDPPENVYVYRTAGSIENGRRLFLEYMREINTIKTQPEFYNTLTTNCTTSIWMASRVNHKHLPFSWKILVSGYVPELMYENGMLVGEGLPFAEVQRRAHINSRANAVGNAADFSQRIRDTNFMNAETIKVTFSRKDVK